MTFIYLLSGKLSLSILEEHNIVTVVIFFSEGFALAAAIIYRINILPGIFLGQFFLGIKILGLVPSLGIAFINTIEALIAIQLFYKFNLNRKLKETKDIFGLIILIIFILQPFSAILGNITLLLFSIITWDEYFYSLFSWWFGNSMGQILLTPMLLYLYAYLKKKDILEFSLVGLFFGLFSYLFQVIVPIHNTSLLLSVTLPPILYLSSVRGLHYATFSIVIIALITLYLTHYQMGVFIQGTAINNIINLNFYFLSQILLVLIIGTLFNEKKRRAKELESLIEKAIKKNREQELMMYHQSKLAQMGEVINMIAHQWRQPLSNINGLVMVMDNKMIKKYQQSPTLLEEEFDKLESITSYMSRTIDDFRDFFRPNKEKITFDVQEIINHSIRLVEPILMLDDVKIHKNYTDKVELFGYPSEIGQVLVNIINNAKDALISNKNIEKKSIYIKLFKKENNVIITIQDNAGGIPETIINQIFKPYFSTKLNKNGTGLGLYISKMIIQEHMGGELLVQNSNGGALFTLRLH
jgi:signal transduction histidine kinase